MKNEINHLYLSCVRFIETGSSKAVIGFARSLLAAGVLLKLSFNSFHFIVPDHKLHTLDSNSVVYKCNFFLLFSPSHLVEMQVLAIIILAFVISGYYIKITSLLHFWISASLFLFRPTRIGVDNIDMLLTLLLIPVCLFDERKNHWHYPLQANKFNSLIQNAFLFFIKLQVVFIYYDSFHDKLLINEWLNGTVIYYWFTHNVSGLYSSLSNILEPILTSLPVLFLLSWSTLLFEALLAIALFFPVRYKLLLLKCGVIFHFSILLVHGFTSLFFVMSAALFLYLYPPKKSFSLLIS